MLRRQEPSDLPKLHGQKSTMQRGDQVFHVVRWAILSSEQDCSLSRERRLTPPKIPPLSFCHRRTELAMPPLATFNVSKRRREKEQARKADLARIENGLAPPRRGARPQRLVLGARPVAHSRNRSPPHHSGCLTAYLDPRIA